MRNLKLIVLVGFFAVSAFAQKRANQHKIVFQFTNAVDTLQQKAFINQLNNLTAHWPNAKYEVVIHSMGLPFVMSAKSKQLNAIKALRAKGVRFLVCENTMKNQKVTKDQLIPEVEYVKVGIAEIVEKQEQGWSYIKGGF
jgi:intracellular sulfur oxidation DsrE/DsrF family protein